MEAVMFLGLCFGLFALVNCLRFLVGRRFWWAAEWGAVVAVVLGCFCLYRMPFHLGVDSENTIFVSFRDDRGSYTINNQVEPDRYEDMQVRVEGLAFSRPFLNPQPDPQKYDIHIISGNIALLLYFSSGHTGEAETIAVTKDGAKAVVSPEVVRYLFDG